MQQELPYLEGESTSSYSFCFPLRSMFGYSKPACMPVPFVWCHMLHVCALYSYIYFFSLGFLAMIGIMDTSSRSVSSFLRPSNHSVCEISCRRNVIFSTVCVTSSDDAYRLFTIVQKIHSVCGVLVVGSLQMLSRNHRLHSFSRLAWSSF